MLEDRNAHAVERFSILHRAILLTLEYTRGNIYASTPFDTLRHPYVMDLLLYPLFCSGTYVSLNLSVDCIHGADFIAIFTTLSVVILFSTDTLGILATLVYVFTMRVVIYDILSMAIIPILSTSILFCNLCYILL